MSEIWAYLLPQPQLAYPDWYPHPAIWRHCCQTVKIKKKKKSKHWNWRIFTDKIFWLGKSVQKEVDDALFRAWSKGTVLECSDRHAQNHVQNAPPITWLETLTKYTSWQCFPVYVACPVPTCTSCLVVRNREHLIKFRDVGLIVQDPTMTWWRPHKGPDLWTFYCILLSWALQSFVKPCRVWKILSYHHSW